MSILDSSEACLSGVQAHLNGVWARLSRVQTRLSGVRARLSEVQVRLCHNHIFRIRICKKRFEMDSHFKAITFFTCP